MNTPLPPPAAPPPEVPPPVLLDTFLGITAAWEEVFPQSRSFLRAVRQALGGILCAGRRTLTRILWTCGLEQDPWAAEYHVFSRCEWDPQDLFEPIWRHALPLCPGPRVAVALDDTRLHKTGRCIKQAFFQRDPLSPPFHVNLMLGLRFQQASLLVPTHKSLASAGARALPVRFVEVSRVKKPGKHATPEELARWKEAQRQFNLCQVAVRTMRDLRAALDRAGGQAQTLIITADGSYCNRTCFGAVIPRTELMARARKDAVLCRRATGGARRFYDPRKFTPESVRQDETLPWRTARLVYGGKRRKVRFKELKGIYWQGGARRRPLRLIVVAPTPYKKRKSGKTHYRAPAFLLTTDLTSPASALIQIHLDRWQIEVNHREEKDTLGVGQAQLRNEKAVPKQPVLAVAAYSALLLAGLLAFGEARGRAYAPLPAWRRKAKRPSCLDLVALLRKEVFQYPQAVLPLDMFISPDHSIAAAAA